MDCASHYQRPGIRTEPYAVELGEVFAGHLRNTLGSTGSREGVPVSMPFPVQQAGKNPQGHLDRIRLLALDGGETLLLQSLEILFRKNRIQDYVGVQVERRVQFGFQRPKPYDGLIQI